jgi:hypothetical protein
MEDVHTSVLTLKVHDIVPANQAINSNMMIQLSVRIWMNVMTIAVHVLMSVLTVTEASTAIALQASE